MRLLCGQLKRSLHYTIQCKLLHSLKPHSQQNVLNTRWLSTTSSRSSQDEQKRSQKKSNFQIAQDFETMASEDNNSMASEDVSNEQVDFNSIKVSKLKEELNAEREAIRKKHIKMQQLMREDNIDEMLNIIYQCYIPLYEELNLYIKPSGRFFKKMFSPNYRIPLKNSSEMDVYNDTQTKAMEQEALALCVQRRKFKLAKKIYTHRQIVMKDIKAAGDPRVQDMEKHLRSFYSWAISVFYDLKEYDKVEEIYHLVDLPTSGMNSVYLSTLFVQRHRTKEMLPFYTKVIESQLPTSIYFFRTMMKYVGLIKDPWLAKDIVANMNASGYKLRLMEYATAIIACDNMYYYDFENNVSKVKHKKSHYISRDSMPPPQDTYDDCLVWMSELESNPDARSTIIEGSRLVLSFLDEIAENEIDITSTNLYPRIMTAAVYAKEFERVPWILSMFENSLPDEMLPPTAARMAVNGYLLMNKPEQAYGFVRSLYNEFDSKSIAAFYNVASYFSRRNEADNLLEILSDLNPQTEAVLLRTEFAKSYLDALIRNKFSLSDEVLWEAVVKLNRIFPIQNTESWFQEFIQKCCNTERYEAVKLAFVHRNKSALPTINGKLTGLCMSLIKKREDWEFVIALYEATTKVHSGGTSKKEMEIVVMGAINALEKLGRIEESKILREKAKL